MKNHYVILSVGAYSDYSPQYFVGETEITQEELTKKSLEIGDEMWKVWEELPEKERRDWRGEMVMGKYDPENPKKYMGNSPRNEDFIEKMTEWLYSIGYTEIPNGLPEINVYYDVPRT